MPGNPLRYPGGKSFLAGYVAKIVNVNDLSGCTIYEPHAGSAAVSLELLSREMVTGIVLIERDPLLYAFWKSVVDHAEDLCNSIDKLEVSLETWHRLLPLRQARTPLEFPVLELGLAGLFYNRANYSGILMAGPLGGKSQSSQYHIDCRFNKQRIVKQILAIAKMRECITVRWDDAVSYLRVYRRSLHEGNCFVYADPPYYREKAKQLYRYHYSDEDHVRLASLMRQCRYPWLISYDDHPFIRSLYFGRQNDIRMQWLYMDYSVCAHRQGSELLISNLELPPVERFNSVAIAAAPRA